MAKSQPQLTDAEKQTFLEQHFLFEIREAMQCVWFLISSLQHKMGKNPDIEQFMENTSLDHFLLHAKNLFEFYYESKKPHLYAHASAFVTGWRPPKRTATINKLRNRVYPEVTHLGWSRLRVPPSDKRWDMADVGIDLLTTTERFLRSLDVKYRSAKMADLQIEVGRIRGWLETRRGRVLPDMFKTLEEGGHQW